MSVLVAPDRSGRASPIAPMRLRSDEDQRLDRHAQVLAGLRAELEEIGASDS